MKKVSLTIIIDYSNREKFEEKWRKDGGCPSHKEVALIPHTKVRTRDCDN